MTCIATNDYINPKMTLTFVKTTRYRQHHARYAGPGIPSLTTHSIEPRMDVESYESLTRPAQFKDASGSLLKQGSPPKN